MPILKEAMKFLVMGVMELEDMLKKKVMKASIR